MITWNEMEVLHAQQLQSSTGESYIQHEQACALLIHLNYDVSDREFVQLIQEIHARSTFVA
ncbi:MAG: hypothetical protein HDQ87_01705 [Clostridia bacterium]|nr:hypothetical protein [Clostridia bacterium]